MANEPSIEQFSDLVFVSGYEWQRWNKNAQEAYVDRALQYWRGRGFPYPDYSDSQIANEFAKLQNVKRDTILLPNHEIHLSTVGIGLANYFHPQMWHVSVHKYGTPFEAFNDDSTLRSCIRKALELWPNRKGASPSVLRDMLRTFSNTRRVSNFRPSVAKALYELYTSPGDRILDFSAGYGGRLLGCLTLDRSYIGYDPCLLQIEGLRRMVSTLRNLGLSWTNVQLDRRCAEDAMILDSPSSYDLVFSSPPYFDREQYSDESTQSYIRYPIYSHWKRGFLKVVIEQSYRLLKPGGRFIINIADISNAPIASDTLEVAKQWYFQEHALKLRMSIMPFNKRNNGRKGFRYEPIFVFRKLS